MSVDTCNKVTHCIFDMDGLLLDTEYLYTKAFNRITNRYGKEWTWEHKAHTMGFKTKNVAGYAVKTLELPLTADEFMQEITGIFQELFPQANPMPGAVRLLKHLKESNVPIALATSSDRGNYELKTRRWRDLFDLFHHKVLGGSDPEVARGKPEPDIFFVAAKRFPDNPDPSKCLVFEDAPNGVKAALKAGMQVVMVPDPMLPKQYTSEATLVLDSLEKFQPEKFGLPPYVT
ncbi:PREDICTED: pseudouridine-5'-phosphatase-like [Wasmannia auropunctata]|uniref:pseudouridine-5'-phosphatase-like n=1 Tax=Wasmannia auropunctata TaxID=64793 RepID=UPI0005ED4D30|nr:PREDICTED: pseudouridine-5'-phosphatase-like [Wasmannia auropunctata]XP_011707195.1 PREDICTED: pseudouridine-5'-phosphatase-like [Wasmannia auropunctata]XP_011708045.1 PREDICTED: pseudouridine-5'-phosphatase-like [Wasmannia auropunctata]XP_011708046.1 PREDICTED: pseudouridine-5'-phosphatase-like [Wasmannia auropunctata]